MGFRSILSFVSILFKPQPQNYLALNPHHQDACGKTLLMFAIQENKSIEEIQSIIAAGCEINAQDMLGNSAILFCTFNNNIDGLKVLLETKIANLELADYRYGYTALHFASELGHVEMVKFLIQNGAEQNALSKENQTPLHRACINNCYDTALVLLHSGVKVDVQDIQGWSALHYATYHKFNNIIDLLKSFGASLETTTHKGSTPLRIAKANKTEDILELLQSPPSLFHLCHKKVLQNYPYYQSKVIEKCTPQQINDLNLKLGELKLS